MGVCVCLCLHNLVSMWIDMYISFINNYNVNLILSKLKDYIALQKLPKTENYCLVYFFKRNLCTTSTP